MLVLRDLQESSVELQNCGVECSHRSVVGNQPALRPVEQLGDDQDLEHLTSFCKWNLLVVVQDLAVLVECRMCQRQTSSDFCALVLSMME